MSSTHNLSVILTGNSTSLRSALMTAGREVKTFGKEVESTGKSAGRMGNLMGTALKTGIIAVGVALAYSIGQAIGFDKAMRNVQSITKNTDGEIRTIGKSLIDMSTKLPQSAKTLAEGLYDIASSGFQGAEGMKVLEASAIAASAGLTTTATAAKTITATLNAYGLEAKEAEHVSNVLFQAVNLGVVTFEELSGTIGDVVGTAAAATVGIEEVSAAIATMTLSGISANEAGTSLNRLIQSLIDPSDELASALHDLGYSSGAAALQQDDLSAVMEKLRGASQGNIEMLLKWFPEIRAARGALALMADEGRNYIEVAHGIANADEGQGAARAALKEQMKSAAAQMEIFKNKINAVATEVGMRLLPTVIGLLNGLTDLGRAGFAVVQEAISRLSPFFISLVGHFENLVDIAEVLLDTFGPVTAAFAVLAGALSITGLNAFATALETVSGILADHPALIQAVAVVLASMYLPNVIASASATGSLAAQTLILKAMYAGDAIAALIQNVALRAMYLGQALTIMTAQMAGGAKATVALKAAFSGLGAGLAVGAAIIAVTKAVQAYGDEVRKAEEDGNSWADSFKGKFDPAKASMDDLQSEIDRLSGASDELQHAANNALNPFLDDRLKTARDNLDETRAPLEELQNTAKYLQEELDISADAALDLATNQKIMGEVTDGVTGEIDAETAAILAQVEALGKAQDALKALYDPIFAMQDAQNSLRDAQQAVNEAIYANNDAIADNNVGQEEMNALNQAAVRAAVGFRGSILGLKAAVADGTVNLNTAIATLYSYVDAGYLTEQQARQAEKEIRALGDTAEEVDGTQTTVTAHANTTEAQSRIERMKYLIASVPTHIKINFEGQVTGTTSVGGQSLQRWGGVVHAYAVAGVTPAHIQRGERIKYAEPETGGEAFVPRRGDHRRSSAVLQEAASWYGYGLVKMATGGMWSSGSRADVRTSAASVVNHKAVFNFPNYVGDKKELIDLVSEGLRQRDRALK